MQNIFPHLVAIAQKELDAVSDDQILFSSDPDTLSMSFSWKTLDDETRRSRRTHPTVIKLHEDFSTSG